MATIKLKKGFDIDLVGRIKSDQVFKADEGKLFAVTPDDFYGIIPRLDKTEGDTVLAGEALFHHKDDENVKVTSPVSGTVKEIRRGARRKIECILIEKNDSHEVKQFDVKGNLIDLLSQSGLLAMIRQRPYDIVPNPAVAPRDIFVTCFDSAPLAPSLKVVLNGREQYLHKGVAALKSLTSGNVYLGCRANNVIEVEGAETNVFVGPHPAGNVGVQIANIKPVNKGEVVWALDVVTLCRIGKLLTEGIVDFSTTVAVTGSRVKEPKYVSCTMGCKIESIINQNIVQDEIENRIINGNALTGTVTTADDFLRAPYRHITVIPEIKKPDEFMGWLSFSPKKFSVYRLFTSWLTGNKKADLDAKINGGERAIVMSGEYDRMLPMDIYSEFLIKAIITFDIDKMEQLGIYEIAPEDFALAEFADTSKLELQHIVRQGLDKMRKEMA